MVITIKFIPKSNLAELYVNDELISCTIGEIDEDEENNETHLVNYYFRHNRLVLTTGLKSFYEMLFEDKVIWDD